MKSFEELTVSARKMNGRIHRIFHLVVDYAKSHEECFITEELHMDSIVNRPIIQDDCRLVPRQAQKVESVILVNCPGHSFGAILTWGLEHGLKQTLYQVLVSIERQCPTLNRELRSQFVFVLETAGCSLGDIPCARSVWWYDLYRGFGLIAREPMPTNANHWLAFSS